MAKKAAKKEWWIVQTHQQVAEFFGVGVETVKKWQAKHKLGKEWHRDVRQIMRWRYGELPTEGDQAKRESRADAEQRRVIAEANIAEVKAAEAISAVVPLEPVRRLMLRFNTEAVTILQGVPELMLAGWPEDLPAEVIAEQRDAAQRIVDSTIGVLRELHQRLGQENIDDESEQGK